MALYLTESDVERLLPMAAAVEAVEAAFRELGAGRATNRPRRRVQVPQGMLHLMPAALPAENAIGYKAYTTIGGRARFHVMLYDLQTGALTAVIEADRLGQRRTGAASGVATRHLARAEATVVGLFGAGWQAESQIEAVCAVRDVREIRVYSRSSERREAFAGRMSGVLGVPARPVEEPRAVVAGADIVITATSSREPVLLGEWLVSGMHVNVVGSNSLLKREVDDAVVERADVLVVDDREHVPLEGGDLLGALERGRIFPEALRELGEVVTGSAPGRTSPEQITLFKSHGLALEDMAAAAHVYREARARGIGVELPF
jgi:ornithine cyclodeaminase/alanine dehydrogenase-like protein (mu-crystallin family)